MRTLLPSILLALAMAVPFVSCEKEEEADPIYINGNTPGSGGTGGTGGSGGTNTGAVDPDDIDIGSDPIFSCDGDNVDYVIYTATSMHSTFLTTSGGGTAVSQFSNASGVPDVAQVQLWGFDWAGASPTPAEMDDFFAPGPRSFSQLPGTPGVMIAIIIDDTDTWSWYQSNVQAQPAESNFTITDAEPYDDGSGVYKLKVRATFQCTLWNYASDDMECVDGIFIGYFTSQI